MSRTKTRTIPFLIAAAATILFIGIGQAGQAQTPEPSNSGVPASVDPKFKPRLGTYYYKFDYNNVSIGIASISINRENDLYKIQVLAQTNDSIDRIYKIRYRGESLMEAEPGIASVKTKTQQQVKAKEKDMTIQFNENGEIKSIEKETEKGGTVDYKVRRLMPEKFTVDPFAATYLVRGSTGRLASKRSSTCTAARADTSSPCGAVTFRAWTWKAPSALPMSSSPRSRSWTTRATWWNPVRSPRTRRSTCLPIRTRMS